MQKFINSEEHVEKLLSRIRAAKELGRFWKLQYWTGVYLNSFDAKWIAVQRVNLRREIKNRLDQATIRAIAARLDPWKGTDEVVLVHQKLKSFDPKLYRTYTAFGIENTALQYLLLPLLEQVADVTPYQYTVRGGMHAAIKQVAKVMSIGPVWAVELDVVDCYPSFDREKLTDLLPVPKEVSEHVLIAEHLNIKGGNIKQVKVKGVKDVVKSGLFGPAGTSKASTLEGVLAAARRGIPQGSATSSLIAEMMMAIALRQVPDLGDIVGYGDNTLLMAKEESDMVTMLEALESAFQGHPVGLLKPKRKLFEPGQPVEFLGHRLIPQSSGKIRIEPSQKAQDRFDRKMRRKLNYLKYEKLSSAVRFRAQRKAKRYVQGWTAAFSLCDGIDDYRKYCLTKIAAASTLEN